MAVERKDRVRDQTSSVGLADFVADGVALAGFRTLLAAHSDGATVRYVAETSDRNQWEVGEGVWTAATFTLTRATIFASSTGAKVSFSAGSKALITGPVAADLEHNHDAAYAPKHGGAHNLGNLTGAITLTLADGVVQYGTATGAVTWTFAGASAAGSRSEFDLELTNGGAFTQTWPAAVKWDGGTAPTLTAAGLDILTFYTRDGGATWRGFLAAKDSK